MTLPAFMQDWYKDMKNHCANRVLQIIMDEKNNDYDHLIVKIVKWRDEE